MGTVLERTWTWELMDRKSMAIRSSYSTKNHKSTSKQLKDKSTHCEERWNREKNNSTIIPITTFLRTWKKTNPLTLTPNTCNSKTPGERTFLSTLCKTTNSQIHTMTQGSMFCPNSTLSQMKNLWFNPNRLFSPSKWPPTTSSSNNSTPQLPIGSSKK